MNLSLNKEKAIRNIRNLLEELFPIHRTLVNKGFKQSLEIIQNTIALDIQTYLSGSKVYDWIIPNAWDVKEAYIKVNGEKIVDFKDNNLHLSAYSTAFKGTISKEQLLEHLNFRKDIPEAIPYNFHYYKKHWSFNVSYNDFINKFTAEQYEVFIDIDEYPDKLRIGEFYLPGRCEEEILITTYMCHPSMANDNLSGVVTCTELFHSLSQVPKDERHYSYRLIIVPETIGAITYLANNENKTRNIKAVLTIYCCGDTGKFHFKKSYHDDSYINRAIAYCFQHNNNFKDDEIIPFWPGGSDERQFNGTGIRLPSGAITRTLPAIFKEYHTSLDTLNLIDNDAIFDTLEKIAFIIQVIECDKTYTNLYKGEPCFSRHNISYPSFYDALNKSSAYGIKILANEIDGNQSLLDIAIKWDLDIFILDKLAKAMVKENLIK